MVTNIVSFSGGRTSAYLVYLMEQKRKVEDIKVDYVFIDTGAEHEATYDFVRAVVKKFNINLTILQAVINPELGKSSDYRVLSLNEMGWDLSVMREAVRKHGNFTVNRPFCTERLKTVPIKKYLQDNYGKDYVSWLGIRADEPRRLKEKNKVKYLAEISDFEKQDVVNWWAKQSFDLQIDEHLGNCIFCIKKNDPKLALAQRCEPEKFEEWCELVRGEHVRPMPADKFGVGHIYRKWLTPENLIAKFSDSTAEQLSEFIYRSRSNDSGSCSESCEAVM